MKLAVDVGLAAGVATVCTIVYWLLAAQVTVAVLVGWLLTTLGWIATAMLALRAQRTMFHHNLLNTARADLVKVIRSNQDWARGLYVYTLTFRSSWDRATAGGVFPIVFRLSKHKEGVELLYKQSAGADLVMMLEEYEVLFPQTRHVRWQLGYFVETRILDVYATTFSEFLMGDLDTFERAVARLEGEAFRDAHDYAAMMEDLLIWVQNTTLSRFARQPVSQRRPKDVAVPIIWMGPDGQLTATENGQPLAIRAEPETRGTDIAEAD